MAKKLATRLGECARAARQRLNLTQEDVAERVGIATEVYGRLERGNMLPSVPTFRKLCAVLSLSADEALGLSTAEGSSSWTPPAPPPEASEPAELRRLMRRARQLDRNSLRVLSLVAAHLGQKNG
ncbi:helix-turn-helix transcriptional regulator [Cystobacter fuscus]|uniref:helix-turn-helix transcriptional regulator n=1 Tax=Cystobacter fuscus TaxID=43 RepID=UPI002B315E5C|nr:helix-turn-helix transcriptional regulator [Cystobacter fuscus]